MRGASRHRAAPAPAGFLDPAVLARIDDLELLARTVVDGFINGLHRSPYLGLSLDFAEHRPYNPGDDIRRVDWRLFARTDRFYVKEFEAETNADFMVLLDVSRSMDYGGAGIRKLDYARYLAACLAWFSRRQRDRVGMATFDDRVIDWVPPSARHLDAVLHALDRVTVATRDPDDHRGADDPPGAHAPDAPDAPDAPGLARAVDHLAEHARRRGITVVISDLYDDPERVVRTVAKLRHRGSDVLVFHVLDPGELEFPFEEATSVQDLETGERIPVVPEAVRERYRERVDAHVSALGRLFAEARIDYALFDTATPLDYALFRYLSERERRSRVR